MEEWRPVAGTAGRYEVSDHGRVRSFVGQGCRPHSKPRPAHYLSLKPNNEGYARVCLGGRRFSLVHTLVLEAFVGPRPEGMECCHGDGNSINNHVSNLRWDTDKANVADAIRHGVFRPATMKVPKGESHYAARLTDDDVRCIRAEPNFVGVCNMLGRAFGHSPSKIAAIRRGEQWKHVEQYL